MIYYNNSEMFSCMQRKTPGIILLRVHKCKTEAAAMTILNKYAYIFTDYNELNLSLFYFLYGAYRELHYTECTKTLFLLINIKFMKHIYYNKYDFCHYIMNSFTDSEIIAYYNKYESSDIWNREDLPYMLIEAMLANKNEAMFKFLMDKGQITLDDMRYLYRLGKGNLAGMLVNYDKEKKFNTSLRL